MIRPRIHRSNAEKQRAYRRRRKGIPIHLRIQKAAMLRLDCRREPTLKNVGLK